MFRSESPSSLLTMPMPIQRYLLVALCLLSFAPASPVSAQTPPMAPAPIPSPPTFQSKSYIMIDFDSGAVLAAYQADERVEPASITKIMTTYLVYEALRQGQISLDDEVLISEKAWRMGGSKMFVEVGDRVELKACLLYTSPSPRDGLLSRMPSS